MLTLEELRCESKKGLSFNNAPPKAWDAVMPVCPLSSHVDLLRPRVATQEATLHWLHFLFQTPVIHGVHEKTRSSNGNLHLLIGTLHSAAINPRDDRMTGTPTIGFPADDTMVKEACITTIKFAIVGQSLVNIAL